MKPRKIYLLIAMSALAAVSASCNGGGYAGKAWTTDDRATLSVLRRLDSSSFQRAYPDSADKLVDTLRYLPDCRDRFPELYWYWKGKMARSALMHDSARKWISRARILCDTVSHVYEYERIKLLESDYEGNFVTRYSGLTNSVAYFHSVGDTLTEAHALNYLGRLYYQLNDSAKAMNCILLAQTKYEMLGEKALSKSILLNMLPYHASCGDFTRVRSILFSMRQDEELMRDSSFLCNWRINAWRYLGDIPALDSLYEQTKDMNGKMDESFMAAILYYKGSQLLTEGDSASWFKLLERSAAHAERSMDAFLKADIFEVYSSQLFIKGKVYEAYRYKEMVGSLRDSIDRIQVQNSVSAIEAKAELDRRSVDEEYSRKRITLMALLSVSLVIVVLLGVAIWHTRRNASLKLRAAKLQTDLERNRHLLAKAIQSMGEKSEYIENLSSQLDNFAGSDSLPGLNSHQRLKSISRKNDKDFNQLMSLVEEVSSTLVMNLKKRHPDIGDGMLQLAVLVASGLNSKEIASTLNIQADSVKKQRYRLRQLLGVEPGRNLTEYLRMMC